MSIESTRRFLDQYMAALNEGDKSRKLIAQFVSDQSLQEHIAMFEAAFPNYKLRADDAVVEEDKVALRATFTGVHGGEFQGIAATGREVNIPLMLIYHIDGGKIKEHRMIADVPELMKQLGAAPVPA